MICKKIGYPILIKAAGGGGGKGMKIVEDESNLENLFLTAKTEAKKFLGMMNFILKNILKIQGILRFKSCLEKINSSPWRKRLLRSEKASKIN